ncbi:hypothetical protein Thermo_00634 [Thermoplasmatales archaeon]|nr:hypothetical protein Thermo_00634 [Thermoplasmatales archaeon]
MGLHRREVWGRKTKLLVLVDVVCVLFLIIMAYLIGQNVFVRIAILVALAFLGWGTPAYLAFSYLKKKKNGDFSKT